MKYNKLIFDVDNTLFDFNRAESAALINTLNHFKLPCPDDMLLFYRDINVSLWQQYDNKIIDIKTLKKQRTRAIFEHIGQQVATDEFADQYLAELSVCDFLLPGVAETLSEMTNQCDMIIITNGLSRVQQPRLKNSAIKSHFKHWVISEEFGHAKPERAIFHHSCELMGWEPNQEVLMVGDNYHCDIQGGKAAGLSTCWFNLFNKMSDSKDHDIEIKKFCELKKFTIS